MTPLALFLAGAAVISAVAFAVIFFGVERPLRRDMKEFHRAAEEARAAIGEAMEPALTAMLKEMVDG